MPPASGGLCGAFTPSLARPVAFAFPLQIPQLLRHPTSLCASACATAGGCAAPHLPPLGARALALAAPPPARRRPAPARSARAGLGAAAALQGREEPTREQSASLSARPAAPPRRPKLLPRRPARSGPLRPAPARSAALFRSLAGDPGTRGVEFPGTAVTRVGVARQHPARDPGISSSASAQGSSHERYL